MKNWKRFSRNALIGVGVLVLGDVAAQWTAYAKEGFSNLVDAKGNIAFPTRFREEMVHLGSWFVPSGGASGFHDVFANRQAVEAYRANGRFPDGAVLVKELRGAHTADYTTGQGVKRATTEVKQWFVMIKDAQGRFADNPQWGEGWGWALYKTDDPTRNVVKDYKADCLGCHVPAKHNDWVYTEGYPALKM